MGKKNAGLFTLLFLLVLTLLFPIELRSEFYKYIDRDGTIHFVDDESKIPNEYRDNVTVYEDKSGHLSEHERSVILEREQRELEDLRKRETEEELAEEKRQEGQIAQKKYEMKVIVKGNHVFVPVTLGYGGKEIEVLLLLDTGAELITLHQEIADQLNIKQSKRVAVRVVGGKVIRARLTKLSYVKVGPHEKTDIYLLIIGHRGPSVRHDGLLGMNFLRGLEYSIDFKNQVIKWKP
ncbi:MAG: clan AA aspartic protease [Deltaproteobacteria bacterium]|nr:clan AA aspartic protease [Deltaproteobacteria bacterium]